MLQYLSSDSELENFSRTKLCRLLNDIGLQFLKRKQKKTNIGKDDIVVTKKFTPNERYLKRTWVYDKRSPNTVHPLSYRRPCEGKTGEKVVPRKKKGLSAKTLKSRVVRKRLA